MANIVDQLVVVLELDASKFNAGIEQAKAVLQSLSGIIKVVDASASALAKSMAQAGQSGDTAAKKTAVGFNLVRTAFNNANGALDKFKRNMQTGESGAAREATKATDETGESLNRVVSGGILANMGLRQILRTVERLNETLGITGLKKTLLETTDSANRLLQDANRLAVDPHVLRSWQGLAHHWHLAPEEVDATLTSIQAKVGAAGTKFRGGKQAMTLFELMGVDPKKMQDKSPLEIFETIINSYNSGKFGAVGSNAAIGKMQAIRKAMGGSEKLFDAATQSGELLIPTLNKIKETTASNAEIDAAAKAEEEKLELERRFGETKLKLMQRFLPVMEKFVHLLERVVGFLDEHPTGMATAIGSLSALVTGLTLALKGLFLVKGVAFLAKLLGFSSGAVVAGEGAASAGALAETGLGMGNAVATTAATGGAAAVAVPVTVATAIAGLSYMVNRAAKEAQKSGDYSGWSDELQVAFGGEIPKVGMSAASNSKAASSQMKIDFHEVNINAGYGADGQEIAAKFTSEVHARMRRLDWVATADQAVW